MQKALKTNRYNLTQTKIYYKYSKIAPQTWHHWKVILNFAMKYVHFNQLKILKS